MPLASPGSRSSALDDFRADLTRHVGADEPLWRKVRVCLETQGLWALAVYRYGRWIYGPDAAAPWPVRVPLKVGYHLAQKLVEVTTGIRIPASCAIGPGLAIDHFGAVVLHPEVRLGRDCSLGQDTTIGTLGLGSNGAPVIGDGVYLGTGCRVLGPIRVGDGASVGANAVVLRDVPPGATAVGVPARIVPGRRRARRSGQLTVSDGPAPTAGGGYRGRTPTAA